MPGLVPSYKSVTCGGHARARARRVSQLETRSCSDGDGEILSRALGRRLLRHQQAARLIQVTDIERFRIETLRRHSRLDQTGVHRSPAESEAWSRRSPREATGKSGEDQHSLDQSAHSRLGIIQSRSESRRERVRLAAQLAIEDHKVAFEMAKLMGRGEVPPLSMYLVYHAELLKLVASGAEVTPLRRLMSLRYGSARKS